MTVRCIFNPTRYTGISLDLKPQMCDEQGVNEGSTFYETDTGFTYRFDGCRWSLLISENRDQDPDSLQQKILVELRRLRRGLEQVLDQELEDPGE